MNIRQYLKEGRADGYDTEWLVYAKLHGIPYRRAFYHLVPFAAWLTAVRKRSGITGKGDKADHEFRRWLIEGAQKVMDEAMGFFARQAQRKNEQEAAL